MTRGGHEGTFLVVQQLRLHAPKAGGMGSIPGQVTKIPGAVWSNLRKNRKEKKSSVAMKQGPTIPDLCAAQACPW